MIHENNLEAKLYELERELKVAELNNWEFDIEVLKDEIKEVEHELYNSYLWRGFYSPPFLGGRHE